MYYAIDKQHKLKRIHTALNAIESFADLHRNKLTLTEYYTAQEVYNEILQHGRTKTFNLNVVAFFKRFGFSATLDYDKVNYIIT